MTVILAVGAGLVAYALIAAVYTKTLNKGEEEALTKDPYFHPIGPINERLKQQRKRVALYVCHDCRVPRVLPAGKIVDEVSDPGDKLRCPECRRKVSRT
jgi:DNA-directed RNA polymerase subunit RPC12/RpoP